MGTFDKYLNENDPEQRARIEQYKTEMHDDIVEYNLQQLRKQAGLTQTELAEELGVSQVRVSALERGRIDDVQIKTLRQYVEALGGQLRLEFDLGGHSVHIA